MPRTRRLLPSVVALLLTGALAAPLAAGVDRWTRIGPYGGIVTALAAAPSRPVVVYAGLSTGGVFRSADAGGTWTFAGSGLVDSSVFALAVHPRAPATVYAATARGLRKTTNGGATWVPVGGEPGTRPVTHLALNLRSPRILWVGLNTGALLKSVDGGATWSRGGAGWPADVLSIALDPARPQNVYVASYQAGAFRSTDGGASWTRLGGGLPAGFLPVSVTVDAHRPGRVFLAGQGTGAGLYRSADGGVTWRRTRRLGAPLVGAIVSVAAAGPLFAATWFEHKVERIWRSDDGGLTWDPMFTLPQGILGSPPPLLATRFGLLAGTGGHGVLASSDQGGSWRASNQGLSALYLSGLAVADQSPPTLYASDIVAGLFKSADRGAHWLRLDTDLDVRLFRFTGQVEIDPHDPLAVYATFFRGFARSDDGGGSWQPFDTSCFLPTSLVPDPVEPGTLYLAGNLTRACRELPDACTSIKVTAAATTCLRHLPVAPAGIEVVAVDPHAPGHLYATAPFSGEGLYHSLDGGGSWSLLAPGLYPFDLVFDPAQSGVVYAGLPGAVGRSADGGATWQLQGEGLPPTDFVLSLAFDPVDPAVLYAGALLEGVFRSADAGGTWTKVAPGLEGLGVWKVLVDPEDPSILYAATRGASVLRVEQRP
ncbi:MAG TPA: hypothetical protein VF121_18985 [Thermoanaerobaculia bacterium]|nr:hypothetical protein [Thermoanaerobaculia bacterium]